MRLLNQEKLEFLILNMDYYDDNVGVVTEWNGKIFGFFREDSINKIRGVR